MEKGREGEVGMNSHLLGKGAEMRIKSDFSPSVARHQLYTGFQSILMIQKWNFWVN